MKGLKLLAFGIGAIAVLFGLTLIAALTPAVQTWALRKALGGQPGLSVEIGRAAAGFSAAELSDLRVTKDGMVLTAAAASARYSLTDYIFGGRINAEQITVQDLVVDLRNANQALAAGSGAPSAALATGTKGTPGTTPAQAAPSPPRGTAPVTPFQGLLSQAQLPFELRVARVAVNGRALLSRDQTVTFELKGTGIETGQRGQLDWTIQFADAVQDAPLQALRAAGITGIQIGPERRILLVTTDATAVASGPKLPADQLKLEARAEKAAANGNEDYAIKLAMVRGGTVEPVFSSNAQFAIATREISGTWDLALRTEQLAAVLAGLDLPTIAARGNGKFAVKPDTGAVTAAGGLQGQIAQLQKLSPALGAVGSVQFATTFDGGVADQIARLDRLELSLTGGDGRKLAEVNTLQRVTYSLAEQRAMLTDPRAQLGRVSLQSLPLAWLQPFVTGITIDSGELSLALAIEADSDGSHLRAQAVEPVAVRSVTLRKGDQKIIDQVSLTVRPKIDYAATRVVAELSDLNLTTPAGDALTGRITADVTDLARTPAIAFVAQLQAKITSVLKPYLPVDPGPLALAIGAEGRLVGTNLQLAKASLSAKRANDALLVAAEIRQPVSADLQKGTFSVPRPDATAAQLKLGEVPLAWAEAFVPQSKFTGTLAGVTADVSFRAVDDIGLNTTEPLLLREAGATIDGKPQVQNLDVTADLTVSKRGQAVAYDVRRVELKQGEASLAVVSAGGEAKLGGKLNLTAKGKVEADAAALMSQPVLAPFATLSRGRVAAVFEATVADATEAKVVVSASDLVARQKNQPLGTLDLSLVASVKADGSGTIAMPVTLTNAGRKSDVRIDGSFGRSASAVAVAGKIVSSNFVVDDFQPLAALAPAKPAAANQPSAVPVSKRDEKPFWSGVNGKLDVDLKSVVYGRDNTIRGIRGAATITDGRLGLDGLEGSFKENPFKLSGEIKFDAKQAKPYALAGAVDVKGLALGEILRAANPSERPAIESSITVVSKLNGNGATLSDLIQGTYGSFDVAGSQGVLRALGRKGQAAGALSLGLGILGAVRGSDTTLALSKLTAMFNELKFDSFKMHVERGADLNLKVSALEFISPEMRTTGTGGITKQGNEPIQNQPMRIDLEFAAKDELALLLNKVGLLADKQDDKGYYVMSRPFTIGGTPAKPDSGILWKIITEAAARGALVR